MSELFSEVFSFTASVSIVFKSLNIEAMKVVNITATVNPGERSFDFHNLRRGFLGYG